MLNITNHSNHWGSKNQNHNKISSHTIRMLTIKNTENKCRRCCKKVEKFIPSSWECKKLQQLWKII